MFNNADFMPTSCIVCGKKKDKNIKLSLHRFPKNPSIRQVWLHELRLSENDISPSSRLCSLHFRDGNASNIPSLSMGEKFGSCPDMTSSRAKRLQRRTSAATAEDATMEGAISPKPTSSNPQQVTIDTLSCTVNAALITRVKSLEAENIKLRKELDTAQKRSFCIDDIASDDNLITLYTGFPSYDVLISFFKFLGPAAYNLNYIGSKSKGIRHRTTKLDALNQLLLTLMKLKLDLNERDIAVRFGISTATVSRYFITWICFLYKHLTELDWFPSPQQIRGTMPAIFQVKYPTTVCIIDASELFIETPSDLFLQSTSWSSYKHHNTCKYLVSCTPNGAVSFISPLYLGSISDPELTQTSGFLDKLQPGVSVMADRGFTIKDMLNNIGADLNLPPFLEDRKQFPAREVKEGRSIATLRIHVERAIGRMKQYKILSGIIRLKMARVANQIVTVVGYISNFHPALVPPPSSCQQASSRSLPEKQQHSPDCSASNSEGDDIILNDDAILNDAMINFDE